MPDLHRVLADHDLGLLELIAELWGVELEAGSQREAADALPGLLLQPELVAEVTGALPPEARSALSALAQGGRQPLAQFMRRYGELRAMGPARRERERPWENAPSASEALWYRGLIGRAFYDDGPGPVEFVFVPDDLRSLLYVADSSPGLSAAPGEPASAPERWAGTPDAAADDAVTLLAYLQVTAVRLEAGQVPPRHREALGRFLRQPAALGLYLALLEQLGLVAGGEAGPLRLEPEQVQPFLQAPRPERARQLAFAWREARDWNDLRHVPGLIFEGLAWRNDPVAARAAILNLLAGVPAGTWWSLGGLIRALKERQPDFQRPAGDYDSWYIRDAATQAYLRGFENWDRVDGALARWLFEGPLLWLGLVETAFEDPARFRLTAHGAALTGQAGWEAGDEAPVPLLRLSADGLVCAPAAGSAYDRFQLARIGAWDPPEGDVYRYRLTPASLARAAHKGIAVSRMLSFLERAAGGAEALAATPDWTLLSGALRRWERQGAEAALREVVVLKLASADLLDLLRRTPAVRDYLGESLGPASVAVRREQAAALRAALAALGILVDD
jgi:hypothetical protein